MKGFFLIALCILLLLATSTVAQDSQELLGVKTILPWGTRQEGRC